MCFVKTLDPLWPCVQTTLSPIDGEIVSHRQRTSRLSQRSQEEVELSRRDFRPQGQTALHLAAQRNSSLEVLQQLVRQDPLTLQLTDNNGNIPLVTALLHGCDFFKSKFLLEQDPSTIDKTNENCQTPLMTAVDFACCCSVSDRPTTTTTTTTTSVQANGLETNAFLVLDYVLQHRLVSADKVQSRGYQDIGGALHTLVTSEGSGRQRVLHRIQSQVEQSMLRLSCRQFRLGPESLLQRTPLHTVCLMRHWHPELIRTLVRIEPACLVMKDSNGQTPLHLLCQPDCQNTHRKYVAPPGTMQAVMKDIVVAFPKVLRIEDHAGRIPLQCYLESEYWCSRGRDPLLLSRMLALYPESVDSLPTPIAHCITTEALVWRRGNTIIEPDCCLHDKDVEKVEGSVDSGLLCLWVVLTHRVLEEKESNPLPRQALEAVRIYLAVSPRPHEALQLNQARCILRLIVHALFASTYAKDVLQSPLGDFDSPSSLTNEEEKEQLSFLTSNVAEWRLIQSRQEIEPTMESLTAELVNVVLRDSQTLSKALLLSEIDQDVYLTMCPTLNPRCSQPSHYQCHFLKPISFLRTFRSNGLTNCQLNSLLFPAMMQHLPLDIVYKRLPILLDFLERNETILGKELVDGFRQFKATLPQDRFEPIRKNEIDREPDIVGLA